MFLCGYGNVIPILVLLTIYALVHTILSFTESHVYFLHHILQIIKLLSYLYLQNNKVAMTERHDISNARAAETVATVNITDSLKTCSTPPPHSLKYNIFVIFGWYNFFIDCQPAPFNAPRMKSKMSRSSTIIISISNPLILNQIKSVI